MSPRNRLQAPRGHGYLLPFCITSSYLHIVGGDEQPETLTLQVCLLGLKQPLKAPGLRVGKSSREKHVSALLPSLGLALAFFFFLGVYGGEGGQEKMNGRRAF